MKARMFRLTQIHQKIDERIRYEMRKVDPNWLEVTRLKRLKIRAKDALRRLDRRPAIS